MTGGVGIVTALAAEARRLGSNTARPDGLSTLPDGNFLCIAGLGEAAARGAETLVRAGVKSLLSFGLAGGLDPTLRAGTVFVPGQVIGGGGAFDCAREGRERLSRALAPLAPLVGGKLLTSARPVESPAAKAALFNSTGAAAVDMESVPIARIAGDSGLPFVAVRVIVDTAHDRVPATAWRIAGGDGQLRPWPIVFAVMRRPHDLGALIRLALRYRVAIRALDAVALAAFPPPS